VTSDAALQFCEGIVGVREQSKRSAQGPGACPALVAARVSGDGILQMDRDLERAKAGLDLIETQTQLANDARMIRIKKAVKTGNLCAALPLALVSQLLMHRSDEIDKLTDEVSREKAQAWVASMQVRVAARRTCSNIVPHCNHLLQSQGSDDASVNKSARMDELRSNLAALTIDFSGTAPSSQLRNKPPSASPPPPPERHAATSQSDEGGNKQQHIAAPPAPPLKSKATTPQPFRREKQKI
jgi:hypothetical protein